MQGKIIQPPSCSKHTCAPAQTSEIRGPPHTDPWLPLKLECPSNTVRRPLYVSLGPFLISSHLLVRGVSYFHGDDLKNPRLWKGPAFHLRNRIRSGDVSQREHAFRNKKLLKTAMCAGGALVKVTFAFRRGMEPET